MVKITVFASTIQNVSPEHAKQFIQWVWEARTINCFDPDVLSYPRSCLLHAEDADGPTLFLPIHPVLMLESLAPRPGISERKEALSLWKIGEQLEEISKMTGIQEQYFLCKDDRVAEICKRHGFTELEGYRILKKKVPPAVLPEPNKIDDSEPIK